MKLYLCFSNVEDLVIDEETTFEDGKADAQKLLEEWKERLHMTKDPIWLGVYEDDKSNKTGSIVVRCLFEIETSAVGGIYELDDDFMSMSRDMGNNLGTRLTVFDFTPSTDCCTQAYDDGEYDTGVINIGDEQGTYAKYTENIRKEWEIEL